MTTNFSDKAELIDRIRGGVIVSCQAPPESPLAKPEIIAAIAQTAENNGAVGVRIDTPSHIAAVSRATGIPIFGIHKVMTEAFEVYITPTFESACSIAEAGCDVIAIDATLRPRPGGEQLKRIHELIKSQLRKLTMADVSTIDEGIMAGEEIGFDFVSTTLSGYTAVSNGNSITPDFALIESLARRISAPIIAEGRLRSPSDVRRAFDCGASAVVVGKAITGIDLLVREFVDAGGRRL
jgi:N-acylglucosamine-6-phosphate 2-epimerase